eukprot:Pgem_evm1s13514
MTRMRTQTCIIGNANSDISHNSINHIQNHNHSNSVSNNIINNVKNNDSVRPNAQSKLLLRNQRTAIVSESKNEKHTFASTQPPVVPRPRAVTLAPRSSTPVPTATPKKFRLNPVTTNPVNNSNNNSYSHLNEKRTSTGKLKTKKGSRISVLSFFPGVKTKKDRKTEEEEDVIKHGISFDSTTQLCLQTDAHYAMYGTVKNKNIAVNRGGQLRGTSHEVKREYKSIPHFNDCSTIDISSNNYNYNNDDRENIYLRHSDSLGFLKDIADGNNNRSNVDVYETSYVDVDQLSLAVRKRLKAPSILYEDVDGMRFVQEENCIYVVPKDIVADSDDDNDDDDDSNINNAKNKQDSSNACSSISSISSSSNDDGTYFDTYFDGGNMHNLPSHVLTMLENIHLNQNSSNGSTAIPYEKSQPLKRNKSTYYVIKGKPPLKSRIASKSDDGNIIIGRQNNKCIDNNSNNSNNNIKDNNNNNNNSSSSSSVSISSSNTDGYNGNNNVNNNNDNDKSLSRNCSVTSSVSNNTANFEDYCLVEQDEDNNIDKPKRKTSDDVYINNDTLEKIKDSILTKSKKEDRLNDECRKNFDSTDYYNHIMGRIQKDKVNKKKSISSVESLMVETMDLLVTIDGSAEEKKKTKRIYKEKSLEQAGHNNNNSNNNSNNNNNNNDNDNDNGNGNGRVFAPTGDAEVDSLYQQTVEQIRKMRK